MWFRSYVACVVKESWKLMGIASQKLFFFVFLLLFLFLFFLFIFFLFFFKQSHSIFLWSVSDFLYNLTTSNNFYYFKLSLKKASTKRFSEPDEKMSNTQDDSLFARLKRSVPEKDSSNTTPDQKTSGSVSVHDDKKSGGSASTERSNNQSYVHS